MQPVPPSSYPLLQEQEKAPSEFAQASFASQLCVPAAHSLISESELFKLVVLYGCGDA